MEPAGNGNENLDDTSLFGSSFPDGKPNSGAIIVGAGAACAGGAPGRSRLGFSDYDSRVNLQGLGECVTTTGYLSSKFYIASSTGTIISYGTS